jgi:sporulation protein YlmC with PRC-barrel domain
VNKMQKHILTIAALAGSLMMATSAHAQSAATVDPACIMKNADGTETVDKAKCPDGMKVGGSAAATTPDTTATTTTPDPAATPNNTAATGSTAAAPGSLIVPPESLTSGKIMSASDFIGKRVYTKAGDDIGEVNDLVVSDNGSVQAVILGVGGFLGMGEKDVAVSMASIEMMPDGNNAAKLVVDGTREQFTAAPTYDRATRTYLK